MAKKTKKYQIIFLFLLFVLPLNIYRIGNNLGSGIQWALFHYQQTIYGNQAFTLIQDLGYVFSGIITGRSAYSLLLWSSGTLVMFVILVYLIFTWLEGKPDDKPLIGISVIISGLLFMLSLIAHYGPTLNGPAGFCIPVGIPVVWIIGYIMYSQSKEYDQENRGEKEQIEEEELAEDGKNEIDDGYSDLL